MKYLIIFGASGNLGRGVTESMDFSHFDRVYLVDRRPENIKGVRKATMIEAGDLTKEREVERVFEQIEKDREGEYFLFTTIGGFSGGTPIEKTDYDTWNLMMDINVNISFLISKYFIRLVKEASGGSICFTSAYSSFGVEKNKTAYNLAKNSLNYLAKSVSLEGKDFNLSANVIAPYILDTPGNREWIKDNSVMTSCKKVGEIVEFIFLNYRHINDSVFRLEGSRRIK